MKRLLVVFALLFSLAEAREIEGTVGFGLSASGSGTGFLASYDVYKFIYVIGNTNDAYLFDWEGYGYTFNDYFEFYAGVGVLYDGGFSARIPLGLNISLVENFYLYVEYGAQLDTTSWTYQNNNALGLKILF